MRLAKKENAAFEELKLEKRTVCWVNMESSQGLVQGLVWKYLCRIGDGGSDWRLLGGPAPTTHKTREVTKTIVSASENPLCGKH